MLRTRLFLNLAPFVVLLLAVGGYAILLFSRLATHVDVTVMESYRSVEAVHDMRDALSKIDTGLRLAISEDKELAGSMFDEYVRVFQENLLVQTTNSPVREELEMTSVLRTNFDVLRGLGATIINSTNQTDKSRILEQDAQPLMHVIEDQLEKIRLFNHQDILATSQNIQDINRHITQSMIIGMAIAFTVSAIFCLKLSKSVLTPILAMTRAIRAIGAGNLNQAVPVLSHDELGELADAFNSMTAQLKIYQLKASERLLRLRYTTEATLASFPDPIFVLDREGNIDLKNPAAHELSTRLNLKNRLPQRLHETAEHVLDSRRDFLPHSFKEVISFRTNGMEKYFLPRVLCMRDNDTTIVGVAVVLYDVTRFRLLDDAKTNLVATVSHELKTPLTSVRMVLHLLLEKTVGTLNDKQEELLVTARTDAERLLRILNDLLDIARLEAGTSDLNCEPVSPDQLVQTVLISEEQAVRNVGLTLQAEILPGLPDVLVDRQRIGHVFHNFITNAIKYSPPGTAIQINVELTNEAEVRFAVLDVGDGIQEEHQKRLFERFYRVPGQTKTGAGLGLSIAREIVVAHGGRIGVRSRKGKGSEFYFILASATEVPSENPEASGSAPHEYRLDDNTASQFRQ